MVELIEDCPVGLDLGTTNSCIGVYRNGGVEIVPNSIGEKTTPSIVTIRDNEILVGEEALDFLVKETDNSIFEIKRFIGRKTDEKEIAKEIKDLPFKIISGDKKVPKVEVKRKGKKVDFTPEEISSFIIQKMVKCAENYINRKINKLIITVPAYFNDSQRNQTKRAAELLDLQVLRIINEPNAAALAYGLEKETSQNSISSAAPVSKDKNILVFDLGGGTFDVSLLKINDSEGNKAFEVKAVSGDTHLGGEDFDNILCNYFIKKFCSRIHINEEKIKQDKKIMKKLKISCECIKKLLSKADSTILNIANFYEKNDIIEKITRKQFEEESKDLFARLIIPINTVLKDAKLEAEEINEVILVGGSTRIPKVKEILKNYFKKSKINDTINPDETVAYGATLDAAKVLIKKDEITSGFNLLDITPLSLGIAVKNKSTDDEVIKLGKEMSVIIPRGKRIPIELKDKYYTASDNQTEVLIEIYEGERKYVNDNHLLGQFRITGLEKKEKGKVSIEVCFNIDVNSILTVKAVENSKSNTGEIKIINDRFDLSEEDMKKIREKNKEDYKLQSKARKTPEDQVNLKHALKVFLEAYETNEDDEDKLGAIINYCETLKELIDLLFGKDKELEENQNKEIFDNETLVEKYYLYVKDLFLSYIKALNLKDVIERETKEKIIKNIKAYLNLFSKHTFGYMHDLLETIKKIPKKLFYDIVIYCMEIMNNNGKKCLKEMKKFCRYQSMLFFDESKKLNKTYIGEETKLSTADRKLLPKYQELTKEAEQYINDINSSAIILLKNSNKLGNLGKGNQTGFTNIAKGYFNNQDQEEEAYVCIVNNFERTLAEIRVQENREPTQEEAFALASIVTININFLGNANYETYLNMAKECERVALASGIDQKVDWYQQFLKTYEKLKKYAGKGDLIVSEIIANCKKENPQIFKKIDESYSKSLKDFVNYIIKNHQYKGYEEDKNKIDFSKIDNELLKHLSLKYNPDNYPLTRDKDIQLKYALMHYINEKINAKLK